MKAYDLLIQGETGLASITGSPEAPGRVGVSVSDIAAGLNAYAAILEALYAREKSGEGAELQIALFAATAEWMAVPLMQYDYTGEAPARVGVRHPSIAPYGAFPTGDGKAIIVGIQNEREWQRFCAMVLGDAALAGDPRFSDNVSRVANRAGARGDDRRAVCDANSGRGRGAARQRRYRFRPRQQRRRSITASAAPPCRGQRRRR